MLSIIIKQKNLFHSTHFHGVTLRKGRMESPGAGVAQNTRTELGSIGKKSEKINFFPVCS